jgi:PTH1 family peptidyl-tRNA hydrolase
MKLVVGLGNPGRRYAKTRHNVGHLFITAFSKQFSVNSRRRAICRKTTVFMNDSGREVLQLVTRYQLLATALLVVHDDMDLPLGEFKLQKGRGAAGHKGVKSIIDTLETKDFWRLRFGIGKPPSDAAPEEFVLDKLTPEELGQLDKVFEEAYPQVLQWIKSTSE